MKKSYLMSLRGSGAVALRPASERLQVLYKIRFCAGVSFSPEQPIVMVTTDSRSRRSYRGDHMAEYLYLTTTGRRSGLPREIEIWFTERDGRFYVIAEHRERAQWVLNILADPHIHVRVGDRS